MSDLRELYQEIILDHGKNPRNFRCLEHASHDAEGVNPLCGDQLHVWLEVDGERIEDIGFTGSGCAISTASASLMTTAAKGKTIAELMTIFELFHEMLTASERRPPPEEIGKLAVLSGVAEFPVRIKCATLPWHTLRAALERRDKPASTE